MSESTMMPAVPFATLTDLADRGRPISDDELVKAQTLLADASQLLIDEMPAAVARATPETLTRIVCNMVLRVLDSGAPMPGIETTQFGVGPFQQSHRWANPTGDLYLTKAERRQLRGPQRASSVSMMPAAAGSEYPGVGDLL